MMLGEVVMSWTSGDPRRESRFRNHVFVVYCSYEEYSDCPAFKAIQNATVYYRKFDSLQLKKILEY